MKGLENQVYMIAYIISNAFALMLLFFSWKHPKLSRVIFSLLFGWASWANWTTVLNSPEDYLNYSSFALIPFYKDFINGWFSQHVQVVVGIIATSQALIAVSLLLKERTYKIAVVGGTIFLLAIMPLGVGSAFPCTLILAIALIMLHKDYRDFVVKGKIRSNTILPH